MDKTYGVHVARVAIAQTAVQVIAEEVKAIVLSVDISVISDVRARGSVV